MSAGSYVRQGTAIPSTRENSSENSRRKHEKGGETLFGLVLALTTLYGLGSLIAFLATWAVR